MAGDESGKPPGGRCIHYWIIQPACGPISQGKCQTCGQTGVFKNYVDADTWADEQGKRRAQKKTVFLDGDEEGEEFFDPDGRKMALAP